LKFTRGTDIPATDRLGWFKTTSDTTAISAPDWGQREHFTPIIHALVERLVHNIWLDWYNMCIGYPANTMV